ncbi:MAG: glucose 1-dehydrogenase [Rhodospirillaceae bacterium]|nr:glucose 1-dehydrogenase [Rhodospirillaceae bacterium]
MANRLNDKVIIVTGGAWGIGASSAALFAAEGARVVVCDIDEEGGLATARSLGNRAVFQKLDVASESDWVSTVEAVVSQFGAVHGVANIAGIARDNDNLETCTPAQWSIMQRINLDGVFLGTKHGVLAMKQSGGGSIVNISSIYGLVSDPTGGTFSYSASKGGVRLLSKSAALHCAREGYAIRVNTIHPGFINTRLATRYFKNIANADAEYAAFIGRHPIGRFGEPEEIALAALYLLSDESAFVTGTEFVVDGGYTAV